jgi:osmotically-inducible protein OsmY
MRNRLFAGLTTLTLATLPMLPMAACMGGGPKPTAHVNQTIDDATVQTRVKTAILNDPQVGGDQIDVQSQNGVVTLTGVIKAPEHEARAADLARKVQGVTDVKTSLKVQGS